MKKFLTYLKEFHKDYFNPKMYILSGLFIALLIAVNYKIDLEDSIIDQRTGKFGHGILLFLIHAIAYYGVILILYYFGSKRLKLTWGFIFKSALGFAILATDRSIFSHLSLWVLDFVPIPTYRFYFKLLFNAYGWITVVLVFALVKIIFDRKETYGIYGLRFNQVHFMTYFLMLLVMVPIIYAASYLPDFVEYYPTYKRVGGARFARFYNIAEIWAKVIYEFFYITDFLSTELFFRGFLVIGLAKLIGKDAIIPMAATYAVLHFGKPMGETISSVFGGYILGILALYSRNIWGGVFIHGGIAFLMEIFAWPQQ